MANVCRIPCPTPLRRAYFAACAGVLLAVAGHPQSPTPYDTLLSHLAGQVDRWRQVAGWSLTFTIVIGLVGLVVAAFQGLKRPWVKTTVVVLGVLVGALTLVNNTMFRADHRAYQRLIAHVETRLNQIQHEVDLFPTLKTEDERDKARARIAQLTNDIDTATEGLVPLSKTAALHQPAQRGLFVATAEASALGAAAKPTWLAGRQPDETRIYFVGVASGSSLDQAVRESRESAVTAATTDISVRLPDVKGINRDDLAAFLAHSAATADTYSEVQGGTYRVYTLVSILKKSIETDALIYGLGRQAQVPQSAVRAVVAITPAPVSYEQRRQATFEQLRIAATRQTSPEVMAEFEAGRDARKAGRTADASRLLAHVVEQEPSFFLAWYNLGLAHEAVGARPLAEGAYRKAIELEPRQSPRDPSVYNTMGWLLLRERRFSEAEPLFAKALEIDPAHRKAKRNLVAAKAKLVVE